SFRCCSVNSARSPWESPATILIVLSKNALLVWRPGVMSRASKKKEEGMDIFPWGLAGGAIALAVFAFLVSQMVFTIHTKQAAVIEKFGEIRTHRGAGAEFQGPVHREGSLHRRPKHAVDGCAGNVQDEGRCDGEGDERYQRGAPGKSGDGSASRGKQDYASVSGGSGG